MPDDKSMRGKPDRNQVAGGEGYEVDFFAHKHGISRADARTMIKTIGNDRTKLDAEAERLKKKR